MQVTERFRPKTGQAEDETSKFITNVKVKVCMCVCPSAYMGWTSREAFSTCEH